MSSDTIVQLEGEGQHYLILEEARRRGIEIVDMTAQDGVLKTMLKRNAQEELIIQGIPNSWMNARAVKLCDEKHLTKTLFEKIGLPTPRSKVFSTPEDIAELGLFDHSRRFVCKPVIGTNGIGVTLDITSMANLIDYYAQNSQLGSSFLLEEYVTGYDLRIQVINGQVAAACVRKPAHVVGNGKQTLQELIDNRAKVVRAQNPANDLVIDADSLDLIDSQGHGLIDVIPHRTRVNLKRVSNMAQGGHAIDVIDQLNPIFSVWVDQVVHELNTGYFALDFICMDHESGAPESSQAIEINIRAEWMHHTFAEAGSYDLAKVVIDGLFQ